MQQSVNDKISKLRFSRFMLSAEDISAYRSALMGVAILWIMFYHSALNLPILNNGYLGVDIFFFLSAIGLCYSFEKNSDYRFFTGNVFSVLFPRGG